MGAFKDMKTWSAPIGILILELICVVGAGRIFKIEFINTLYVHAKHIFENTWGRKQYISIGQIKTK